MGRESHDEHPAQTKPPLSLCPDASSPEGVPSLGCPEAVPALAAQDHMICKGDTQALTGRAEACGEGTILSGRGWIS